MTGDVFEYALLRVMPRVERGELINAGVIVYCKARSYIAIRTHLDEQRLRAIDPAADVEGVRCALRAIESSNPADQPGGEDDPSKRFHWLTAPRSTVIQPGPVHTGLTSDPAAELERLLALLVRPPATAPVLDTAPAPENALGPET
ncbi:MAG: DUF3037 domain-containing protein [Actinomycetota bacterium]